MQKDSSAEPTKQTHSPRQTEWKYWTDTSLILISTTISCIPLKAFPVYWINITNELDLTRKQFAYILIAGDVGCILSTFVSLFNIIIFKKSKYVSIINALLCGISILLFLLFSFIESSELCFAMELIAWGLFGFYLFGLYLNSTHLGTFYTIEEEVQETLTALLDMGWPFASACLICVGYALEYNGFIPLLAVIGCALCLSSFIQWFSWKNRLEIDEYQLQLQNSKDKSQLIMDVFKEFWSVCKAFNLVIFESLAFYMSTCLLNSCAPGLWFEDIYGYSSSQVGLFTLGIFAMEVFGTVFYQTTIHKLGVWFWCVLNYGTLIGFLIATLIFKYCGYLEFWFIAIVVIIWYVCLTIQLPIDVIIILRIAQNKGVSPRMMFSIYFMNLMIGYMFGALILSEIWDHGNGLNETLWISLVCSIVSAITYIVIYKKGEWKSDECEYEAIDDTDNEQSGGHVQEMAVV